MTTPDRYAAAWCGVDWAEACSADALSAALAATAAAVMREIEREDI
ncbi:hypothetical protein [Streptomyces sp. NPDC002692]